MSVEHWCNDNTGESPSRFPGIKLVPLPLLTRRNLNWLAWAKNRTSAEKAATKGLRHDTAHSKWKLLLCGKYGNHSWYCNTVAMKCTLECEKNVNFKWINPLITKITYGKVNHCATRRKVAGSIPDGVTALFHRYKPSGRNMAQVST